MALLCPLSLAAGPHPRRELTPMPRLGFTTSSARHGRRRSPLPSCPSCLSSRSSQYLAPRPLAPFRRPVELPALVVDGQRISHEVAREPALRTQAQLVERQESGRSIYAALEVVARLEIGRLRRRPGRESPSCPRARDGSGLKISAPFPCQYSAKKFLIADVAGTRLHCMHHSRRFPSTCRDCCRGTCACRS